MPAATGRAPSIRDVAKHAGVSHQTVSRVINQSPRLRPETRDRVLAAIEELGYRPSAAARALAQGRSGRIGLLIESTSHYGPVGMARGVEVAARQAGYSSTTYSVVPGSSDSFRSGVEFMSNQDVEAMAIIAPRMQYLESLLGTDLPGVGVLVGSPSVDGDPAEELGLQRVCVDQGQGTRLAVEHLVGQGHQVIAHLSGPLDWFDARVRRSAWEEVLGAHGLEIPPLLEGDWSADRGYEATEELLQIPGLTAVFVGNDQMALGLIHGLSDRGLRIPEDISIVGFDDIPESGHFRPPLTTVHQDFQALGEAAVALMLAKLSDTEGTVITRVEPELVVRASSIAI